MNSKHVIGIDVGGSGIKGNIVNIETGELMSERVRIDTPKPAVPKAVAKVFAEVIKELDCDSDIIGCGFPAIVKKGVAHSAANIDEAWIGTDVAKLFEDVSGKQVKVINDADAAGIGEMQFGVGMDEEDVVILVTLGTGIGSALFIDGELVPNTELGHLKLKGDIAEKYAASSIRKKHDLSWKEWGNRVDFYLRHLNRLFSPDLIILSGGVSKKYDEYSKYLTDDIRILPAQMRNNAGIVGAAYHAWKKFKY